MNIWLRKPLISAVAGTLVFVGAAMAADGAGKDEAVAMVKKAVAFIKEQGPEKAYPEITNKAGKFIDRDLYVVVYKLDGTVLAHGSNEKFVGKDLSDAQDVDGKLYVKERVELAVAEIHQECACVGQIVAVKELSARCAGAPYFHRSLARSFRLVTFPDQRREDMRSREVVVVPGTVQIGRH